MTLIDDLRRDDALCGQTIGKYELSHQLGRGSFGRVYLAQDRALGRAVALKFLLPDAYGSYTPSYRRRFEDEARLISRLSGLHTPTLHDYGELDGVLYHVLEFVDGHTLSEVLATDGAMPHPHVTALLEQLLEALREAHHHGIVHRDIKPSNIMLYRHLGEERRAKLMDFGISRDLTHVGTKNTSTGQLVGTVRYMSPEQTRSYEDITPASDLYSLGMVAYEMLVGTSPFDDSMSPIHVLSQIVRDEDVLLPEDLDVPPSLRHVVHRMLAKDLEARYSCARRVLDDLRARPSPDDLDLVAAPTIEDASAPDTAKLIEELRAPVVRTRTLAALAVALVLLVPGVALMTFLLAEREGASIDTSSPTVPSAGADVRAPDPKAWSAASVELIQAVAGAAAAAREERAPESKASKRTRSSTARRARARRPTPDTQSSRAPDVDPPHPSATTPIPPASFDHLVPIGVAKPKEQR
ncbi:MAG: serine/threonine-protein kinase [Myxococcota bacterium]